MHQFLLICIAVVCIHDTRDVSAFTTRPTQLSNRRLINKPPADHSSLNKLIPPPIQSTSSLFFSGTTNDQKFQSIIENSSDDTVQLLRNELKSRLLSAVDEYNTMRTLEEETQQRPLPKQKKKKQIKKIEDMLFDYYTELYVRYPNLKRRIQHQQQRKIQQSN